MSTRPPTDDDKLPQLCLGVSRCLLGEPVRYDGGHKKQDGLLEPLAVQATMFGVCPEVEIGLGVPREPIQLVQCGTQIEVRGVRDPTRQVGEALHCYADNTLQQQVVDGWILKSGSPSCGVQDTPVFDQQGQQRTTASGAFAARLAQKQPACPMITERQLVVPALRDSFLERVFVYRRWRQGSANGMDAEQSRAFQRGISLQLQMRGESVGGMYGLTGVPHNESSRGTQAYLLTLMQVLSTPLTRQGEAHALRQWRNDPQSGVEQTQELSSVIDAYEQQQCDRGRVVELFNQSAGKMPLPFYFSPEAAEWYLRYL